MQLTAIWDQRDESLQLQTNRRATSIAEGNAANAGEREIENICISKEPESK